MAASGIRVGVALLAFVGVFAGMIALAYGWVAIYSLWIEPGHDAAFYEDYAQRASPVIGVLASLPACWLAARWIRSRVGDASALPTALLAGALIVAMDLLTIVAMATPAQALACALAVPLKIAGGWLALRGISPLERRGPDPGRTPVPD